jgi:hypothetical protein
MLSVQELSLLPYRLSVRLVRSQQRVRVASRRREHHLYDRRRLALPHTPTKCLFQLLQLHLLRELCHLRSLPVVHRRRQVFSSGAKIRSRGLPRSVPHSLLQTSGLRLLPGSKGTMRLVRSHPTVLQFLGLHQRVSVRIVQGVVRSSVSAGDGAREQYVTDPAFGRTMQIVLFAQ